MLYNYKHCCVLVKTNLIFSLLFQELTGLTTLQTKVLLPVSTLVNAYCTRVNPECATVQEVQDFISILQNNIIGGCNVDQQNFRTVSLTIPANTGYNKLSLITNSQLFVFVFCFFCIVVVIARVVILIPV